MGLHYRLLEWGRSRFNLFRVVISKRNGKEEENRGMVSLAHIITQNGIRISLKRERNVAITIIISREGSR
jgi:hypothetical protein